MVCPMARETQADRARPARLPSVQYYWLRLLPATALARLARWACPARSLLQAVVLRKRACHVQGSRIFI